MIYNNIGELRKDNPNPDIGTYARVRCGKNRKVRWYVFVECKKCKEGRWVNNWKFNNKSQGYCVRCRSESCRGSNSVTWVGGRFIDLQGYVWVIIYPDNPYYSMGRNIGGSSYYVKEHRLVMAQHLGRPLKSNEIVHHKPPGIKDDNRIENLKLTSSKRHFKEDGEVVLQLEERVKALEARNTHLEAEVALLTAQLEKDGIQY